MQNGALTKTYYDANSNVIKTQTKSNAANETDKYDTVEYEYDVFNRLSSSKQYANDTTPVYTNYWRSHLEAELLVTYGDDNNSVWDLGTDTAQIDYSIDPYGNVTAMTTHDIMESYFYDYQGRMITQNQGKTGPYDTKRTAYAYNGFDNITSKTATLPNGNSQSISYTYNQLGLRTSMTDSTGTTTYAYTPFGELLSETKGTTVKNYAYDNMGNRTLFTLTMDGAQNLNTSYTYDVLNRLASVTENMNTVSYTYDNNSNILQTVKADGSIENYTYNNANQLTQKVRTLNGVEKESYAYTYYLNGNIRAQNETLPATVNHTYTYDGMGRLTNETVSGSYTRNDTYTYDKRGNRTSLTGIDETTTYTYNKNNQLLTLERVLPEYTDSLTYTYDDYGNRISKNGMLYGYYEWHDYSYDVFNRLTNVSICGSYSLNYTYDGDNIRQSVTENYNDPITEIYDGGNLVARKQGSDIHAYIYGIEQEFYISGNNFGIYSTNHRGDISKEIQLNTNTEKTRAYSAYGTPVASAYSNISPFGYAGEVMGNTGLVYLRNRYYDPDTGTFLTLDPIKDGLNWYAYCAGNPVMFVDPWGLKNYLLIAGQDEGNAQTFFNNCETYVNDNITKDDTFIIIDMPNSKMRTYTMDTDGSIIQNSIDVNIKNKADLKQIMADAYGSKGIDTLIFETHGYLPYVTYNDADGRDIHFTKEDAYDFGYDSRMREFTDIVFKRPYIKLNKGANIGFRGCQIGNRNNNGFAQHWSNITGATIWAAQNSVNTSQVALKGGGAYYQMTSTAISEGLKNGTITIDNNGAYWTSVKPVNTGFSKYVKS